MILGFDAKRAFFNNTGLGNYSRSLIESLSNFFPENSYQLFSPKPKNLKWFEGINVKKNLVIISPSPLLPSSFWRSFLIPNAVKKQHTKIYHGLSAELPMIEMPKSTRTLVTIHDLIFLRFPELYKKTDREIYLSKTKSACKNADKIIAISEQTKRDLVHFLNIDKRKIEVVYQDCNPVFAEQVSSEKIIELKEKYTLPNEFLFCLGTIEFRKNALVILKALLLLPKNIKLVLAGKPTEYVDLLKKFISENELEDRVLFLHNVPFADLPTLYQAAKIFVYPSIFEGFGIPILEALRSKVPVIAATGSCLEEVGGLNSLYFHPKDENTLAKHITDLWNDDTARKKQVDAGVQYAEKFSPFLFAQHTMNVYEKLLK